VLMCHEGATICVSPNAVAAHLGHGDFLGPCVGCAEDRSEQGASGLSGLRLKVSPNPAAGVVTLRLGDWSGRQEVSFEIVNALGQVMLRKSLGKVESFHEEVDLSRFDRGIYRVRVQAGGRQFEQKLVVSRD
jgi:hypothetical protein